MWGGGCRPSRWPPLITHPPGPSWPRHATAAGGSRATPRPRRGATPKGRGHLTGRVRALVWPVAGLRLHPMISTRRDLRCRSVDSPESARGLCGAARDAAQTRDDICRSQPDHRGAPGSLAAVDAAPLSSWSSRSRSCSAARALSSDNSACRLPPCRIAVHSA